MTTDSLTAGADHWSAVRFFIQQLKTSILVTKPDLLYILSSFYAAKNASEHIAFCQIRSINNKSVALLKAMGHHI